MKRLCNIFPNVLYRVCLAALLLALPAACFMGRFGKTGSAHEDMSKAAQSDIPDRCSQEEDCLQGQSCCGGTCLQCCSDSRCGETASCGQQICDEGECLVGKPFEWPLRGAVIEPLAAVRTFQVEDMLMAAAADHSIFMFDLSGQEPSLHTSIYFEHEIAALLIRDGVLYVETVSEAEGRQRLHMVDISNPRKPRKLTVLSSDVVDAFAVEGPLLWVVSNAIVYIVDVSSPADPDLVSYRSLPCYGSDVSVLEGRMMEACGAEGLFAVSASDPRRPQAEKVELPGLAVAEKIVGAGGKWALLGRFDSSGQSKRKIVVYAASEEGVGEPAAELDAGDIKDFQFDGTSILLEKPDGTVTVAAVDGSGASPSPPEGSVLHVLAGGCLISRMENSDLSVGCTEDVAGGLIRSGLCRSLADADFSGGSGVLGCREGGVLLLDPSVPAFPAARGYLAVPEGVRRTILLDGALVVVDGQSGIQTFASPFKPGAKASRFDYGAELGAGIIDAAAAGASGTAAVVDESGFLRMLRFPSTGAPPSLAGEAKMKGKPAAVSVDEESGILYAREEGGVEVFDIGDPYAPAPLSHVAAKGRGALAGKGNDIFVADGECVRHFARKGAAAWKGADPVGGREVFDIFLGEDVLVVGERAAAMIYRRAQEGEAWTLAQEIPIPEGGAGSILGRGETLALLGEGGLDMIRLSYPSAGFGGAAAVKDEAAAAGEMFFLGAVKEKNYFVGGAGPGRIVVYEEDKGGLGKAADLSFSPGIDRIRPAGEWTAAGFSFDGNLKLFDFTDPLGPLEVKAAKVDERIVDAAADRKTLCLALEGGGMGVVSMGKGTANVARVPGVAIDGAAGLAAGKVRCWGIDPDGGIVVVNAVDPSSPFVENYLPAPLLGKVKRIGLEGSHLLAATSGRLLVIDVSDLSGLFVAGSGEILRTQVKGIFASGPVTGIFGTEGSETVLQFVDIADPAEPGFSGAIKMAFGLDQASVAGFRALLFSGADRVYPRRWLDFSCLKPPENPPPKYVEPEEE
jgi:hypothetical protein